MNTKRLGYKLAMLQAAKPSLARRCFGTNSHRSEIPHLSVQLLQGHTVLLPWSRYVRVWHYKEEPLERLLLVFTGTEIVVQGTQLGLIMESIQDGSLGWIRELPAHYRSFHEPGETIIERLEVYEGSTAAEPAAPKEEEAPGGPAGPLSLGMKL